MSDQLTTASDQIAEMCGYKCDRPAGIWFTPPIAGVRMVACYLPHNPIPACLNFVSRVWPDGWEWWKEAHDDATISRYGCRCLGRSSIPHSEFMLVTGDELTDRMTLLLKILRWLRDHDRPAFDVACEKIRKECNR